MHRTRPNKLSIPSHSGLPCRAQLRSCHAKWERCRAHQQLFQRGPESSVFPLWAGRVAAIQPQQVQPVWTGARVCRKGQDRRLAVYQPGTIHTPFWGGGEKKTFWHICIRMFVTTRKNENVNFFVLITDNAPTHWHSCKQQKRNPQAPSFLCSQTDAQTRNRQAANAAKLAKRRDDIAFWKSELYSELHKMCNEMQNLAESCKLLDKAFNATKQPLAIAENCLHAREGREGIDKVSATARSRQCMESSISGFVQTKKRTFFSGGWWGGERSHQGGPNNQNLSRKDARPDGKIPRTDADEQSSKVRSGSWRQGQTPRPGPGWQSSPDEHVQQLPQLVSRRGLPGVPSSSFFCVLSSDLTFFVKILFFTCFMPKNLACATTQPFCKQHKFQNSKKVLL